MIGTAKIHPEFKGYGSASYGVCYLCRLSRRAGDSVVDFGIDIGDEVGNTGALQVCSSCIQHVSRLVGMTSEDELVRLQGLLDERDALLADTSERAEAAEAAVAALRRVDAVKARRPPAAK